MPDIKIKPQMEKPKVLEISRAPKEAGTLLKEQYDAQRRDTGPKEKSPVQFATDSVETSTRRGTILAADGARRGIRRQRAAIKDRETVQPQQAADASKNQQEWRRRSAGANGQLRGTDAASNPCAQNPANTPVVPQTQATPEMIRECGRQKAVHDAGLARVKARNLAEKENTATPGTIKTTRSQNPATGGVRQKSVATPKTCSTFTRSISGTDQALMPTAFAAKRAKQEAHKRMRHQMVQQTMTKAKKSAVKTAQSGARVAKAVTRAIAEVAKTIVAAGGSTLLLVSVLLVALIAAIAASPFGIFFSGENTGSDAVPVSVAVTEINSDFNSQLEALQGSETYDDVVIEGTAADWPEVLAVFASKVAGADDFEAADVVTIDRDRVDKLKAVFWDMTSISSYVQEIEHGNRDPDDDMDDSWTEYILHITITAKAATDMHGDQKLSIKM